MKLRTFFIIVFILGVCISAIYSAGFLASHHTIGNVAGTRFFLLIALSLALQMAAHYVRAYKSKLLLDCVRRTKPLVLFQGLSIGYLFNSLLPLRLGEFIRAFYVGNALAISKTTTFIAIVIERIVDGVILGVAFISAGLIVHSFSHSGSLLLTRLGIGLLTVSLFLAMCIELIRRQQRSLLRAVRAATGIYNAKLADRMRFMVWSGIYGTRLMLHDTRTVLQYLLASVGMWFMYFCSMAVIIYAYFQALSIGRFWFITQASYAGISTPIGPGYIGTFHLITSRLLATIGMRTTSGFLIFVWLVITVPISLVGLAVLIKHRFDQGHDISHQEALINKLYREKDVSAEFSHFLDAYFLGEQINRILTQAELDGSFKLVKSFRGGSNAHTLLVWQNQQLVVKKITLLQYADKLSSQAEWLLAREQLPHLPRVVRQEKTQTYYYFDIAYRDNYYPFFDFIHSHTTSASFKILERMLRFMRKSIYQTGAPTNNTDDLHSYIQSKVLGKINDTAAVNSMIAQLLLLPKLRINGVTCNNIPSILEWIRRHTNALDDLSSYTQSPIHGDLTVDNLIASDTGDFLVLDPNNENQVSAPVVDYGKVYQSLHSGYEFLIQLENCQVSGSRIDFEDSKSQKYADLFRLVDAKLRKELAPGEYKSILFHEAVHYCRMLTYRANIRPETLPVFYATAVRLFNEFMEQYAK